MGNLKLFKMTCVEILAYHLPSGATWGNLFHLSEPVSSSVKCRWHCWFDGYLVRMACVKHCSTLPVTMGLPRDLNKSHQTPTPCPFSSPDLPTSTSWREDTMPFLSSCSQACKHSWRDSYGSASCSHFTSSFLRVEVKY